MAREQLDDLMDARAEIRRLKQQVANTRAAFNDAKSALADKSALVEEILTQMEQKQGRLPFDPSAGKPKSKRPKRDADSHDEPRSEAI
jgi:hypothetical protein